MYQSAGIFVFDLGEDYESLPGDSKNVKAVELIAKMNRHGRLQDLINHGEQTRHDVSWTYVKSGS